MENITQALGITALLLIVSVTLVGLAMWGVYRFFKEDKDKASK
jgi:hypothetical protein